jgi:L-threonylcarbamoyladenylate synthase
MQRFSSSPMQRFACDAAGVSEAAALLKAGGCVAFPTETVYGLGANALCAPAVASIFAFKGRPASDPLIVHTPDAVSAEALLVLCAPCRAALRVLAAAFWPGPLTLVAPAVAAVPPAVTAGTGRVGVRVPAHPVALALLRAAGMPLAAPSANRFGHVSPTCAAHVEADLGAHPIGVLQGEEGGAPTCSVGIESTVARLAPAPGGGVELTVLRRGGVGVAALRAALTAGAAAGLLLGPAAVVAAAAGGASPAESDGDGAPPAAVPDAPGQLLRHYAPDVPTFMVSPRGGDDGAPPLPPPQPPLPPPAACVVLDFGGQLAALAPVARGYREIAPNGDAAAAARGLFAALRWAEGLEGARAVLLADPRGAAAGDEAERDAGEAVRDRLFRACSGRIVPLRDAEGDGETN